MERNTLNEWIRKYSHGSSFDEKKCRASVDRLYELSGLEKPDMIVVGSPMAAQKKANELMGRKPTECFFEPFLFPLLYDGCSQSSSEQIKELIETDVYDMITLTDVCIVVKKPLEVHLSNGKLHNSDGPCIRWADGSELHAINGRMS